MKRDYDDPVYKAWRAAVRRRDRSTCQMPGCKRKRRLQVHHIQKWSTNPSLRFDINNGITLCYDCHKDVTKNEHHYISLFLEIIGRKRNGK